MDQTDSVLRTKKIVDGLELSDEDKDVVVMVVGAMIDADKDKITVMLQDLDDERRLNILKTANFVIDELRLETEEEIIENGDPKEVKILSEMVQEEDKNLAQLYDEVGKIRQQQTNPSQNQPQGQAATKSDEQKIADVLLAKSKDK